MNSADPAPLDTGASVGIIGIGAMGGAMARCLLRNGYRVVVHDVVTERVAALALCGAIPAADPARLARQAGFVFTVVVDAAQTDEVLFGAHGVLQQAAPGTIVVMCSTVAPEYAAGLPARLEAGGLGFIDAPISGGPARAEAGTLSMMAAGPAATLERALPLLEAVASRVFRVGERAGDGSRMKIVNNMLAGINLAAAAEAMALAERMGMNLQLVHDVVCASSGGSWIFADRMPRMIAADYAPRAAAKILHKDVGLAVAAAAAAGVVAAIACAAHRVYAGTLLQGRGEADDAALIEYYRALAGTLPDATNSR
ncbi:MAG: NAD(P)-dependent oxidoreductase [Betaproteobacteria bacterium]